jgi:hypothetical protein
MDRDKKQQGGGFHQDGKKKDEKLPENSKKNLDKKLDHALEETFPTSDPVSVKITKSRQSAVGQAGRAIEARRSAPGAIADSPLPTASLHLQQPPRDHLRLDLRRALEDRQDARVAEHAADRVFEREAVAAVDLERVVGGRPGDAGA